MPSTIGKPQPVLIPKHVSGVFLVTPFFFEMVVFPCKYCACLLGKTNIGICKASDTINTLNMYSGESKS